MPQIHRERVLRAATSSFLTRGYRSSVDEIARRAGVAKQTVYQHFPSKDELFKEVARDLTRRVLVELDTGPRDVRAGLMRVARAYRKRVLGAQGIATLRTVVPEVSRFRALARAMYAGGAGALRCRSRARAFSAGGARALVARLAAYLAGAMAAGELRRDDPQLAAEIF